MPHHHAYQWTGPATSLSRNGPRRPAEPPLPPTHKAVFDSSEVPPLELAHWLLRPPNQIRATFHGQDEGADWMRARFLEHVPLLDPPWPEDHTPTRLGDLHTSAVRALASGHDVTWGYYLTGQRFFHASLIGCPNQFRPVLPCPLNLATAPDGGE